MDSRDIFEGIEMTRPKCDRCGGPLDFFYDPDSRRQEWHCNNPSPIYSDGGFQEVWDNLPGDDVVRLEITLSQRS